MKSESGLRTSLSRRTALRGAAVGLAGVAGAVLLGCGGSKPSSNNGASGTSAPAASGGPNGAPKNIVRADGFDPKFGTVPVNTKQMVPGGTYRRAVTDTSRQNDPDVSIALSDWELIGDRLVYANGFTMKITPDMLVSYEITNPQGLEMVFKMRPGIKTQNVAPLNGRIFTASDVAYSIKRKAGLLDPKLASQKYPRYAQYSGLSDAVAVDDTTVKVSFAKPNGSIMAALSDPRAQMMPIEMEQVGFNDPMKMAGTGAWVEAAYSDGTRQTFKANPNYYRSYDEGGRPGVDTYENVVIGDRASTLAAFLSGQIDVFSAVQPQEEPQVRSSMKDAQWYLTPGPTWDHFAMNLKLPMFQDDRVRQAFQLAIDYKAYSDPLGKGWLYCGPTHEMFPESLTSDEISQMPGYNPATKQADIANAVKLMDAAGYHDGQGMSWTQLNFSSVTDSNVRIKDQLNQIWPKIGITIQAVTDYAQFTNFLNSRTFQARVYNHTSVPDAAIDAVTYYRTDGGRNYQSYSRPWADDLLNKLTVAQTLPDRKALVQQFEKQYVAEGPPLLQLRTPPDSLAVAPYVAGIDMADGPWAYNGYGVSPRWTWFTRKA